MRFKTFFYSLFLVLNLFFFTVVQAAQTPTGTVTLENPIKYGPDPVSILSAVIKGALGIMGALALIMVVLGARKWLMAGGNSEQIESGTKTITWAVLGIVLTLSSYILLKSILASF